MVDAKGRAYIGNFGFDMFNRETPRSTVLVMATRDGHARVVAEDLFFPNGCVITPDGGTLVVGESFTGGLTAFTIDDDGSLHDRRERARVWGGGRWGLEVESSGGIDAQVRNSRAAQFLDLLVGSNQERVTHEGRSKPGHVKFGDMHADSKRVNCNGSVCHNACWSPAGDIQAEIIQPSYRLRP